MKPRWRLALPDETDRVDLISRTVIECCFTIIQPFTELVVETTFWIIRGRSSFGPDHRTEHGRLADVEKTNISIKISHEKGFKKLNESVSYCFFFVVVYVVFRQLLLTDRKRLDIQQFQCKKKSILFLGQRCNPPSSRVVFA